MITRRAVNPGGYGGSVAPLDRGPLAERSVQQCLPAKPTAKRSGGAGGAAAEMTAGRER